MSSTEPTTEHLAAVFANAGLDVPADRLADRFPAYSAQLAVVRAANVPGLGETVPQTAFNTAWE